MSIQGWRRRGLSGQGRLLRANKGDEKKKVLYGDSQADGALINVLASSNQKPRQANQQAGIVQPRQGAENTVDSLNESRRRIRLEVLLIKQACAAAS